MAQPSNGEHAHNDSAEKFLEAIIEDYTETFKEGGHYGPVDIKIARDRLNRLNKEEQARARALCGEQLLREEIDVDFFNIVFSHQVNDKHGATKDVSHDTADEYFQSIEQAIIPLLEEGEEVPLEIMHAARARTGLMKHEEAKALREVVGKSALDGELDPELLNIMFDRSDYSNFQNIAFLSKAINFTLERYNITSMIMLLKAVATWFGGGNAKSLDQKKAQQIVFTKIPALKQKHDDLLDNEQRLLSDLETKKTGKKIQRASKRSLLQYKKN